MRRAPAVMFGRWRASGVGRCAVACAAAMCLVAACASGDTVATGGPDGPILDTFDLSTPIATTAPVAHDLLDVDPTPLVLATATPFEEVPPIATAAPSVQQPSVVPTAQPPRVPPVAATVAPATGGPAPTVAPPTPAPISGSQTILAANGGEVYTLNCARCHAENGLGTGQYSSPLIGVGNTYSTAGMIAELANGHPVTFGFADRLSAEEIASVVAYVKATFP